MKYFWRFKILAPPPVIKQKPVLKIKEVVVPASFNYSSLPSNVTEILNQMTPVEAWYQVEIL